MKKSKTMFFLCALLLTAVVFSCLPIQIFADETETQQNRVTMSSAQEIFQGNTYYGYVYLDNPSEVASLNVSVHYDPAFVSVTSTYNQIECSIYDSSIKDNSLNYSYIFGDNAPSEKTLLFYFIYSASEEAPAENSFFDIVIDEAYSYDLNAADVCGSRYYFHVNEKKANKVADIFGTTSISTQKEQEFEVDYFINTTEIASGSFVIQYDKELFELVSLTQYGFFNGKIVDVNSNLKGAVYVSFIGTEYATSTQLFRVKYKTIANETSTTQINMVVPELYNLELEKVSCSGFDTRVNLTYDGKHDESLSKIFLNSSYNADKNQVQLTVKLSADTHLGAGDFILNWDTNYLQCSSCEKMFSPSYFNINDKQVNGGILKFSIISLSDITEASDVLGVTFDVVKSHDEINTEVSISGDALSDALTNPIIINFVGCNQSIPGEHKYGDWYEAVQPTCTEKGEERRDCKYCDHFETRETAALGHVFSTEWTVDIEPTYSIPGSKSHHCTRVGCNQTADATEIPILIGKLALNNTPITTSWGLEFSTEICATQLGGQGGTFTVYLNPLAATYISHVEKPGVTVNHSDNTITVTVDHSVEENEVLLTLICRTSSELASGEHVLLSLTDNDANSSDFSPLTIYQMGDVNLDGHVNSRDVTMIKQYVVKMITLSDAQKTYANVYVDFDNDGNNIVSSRDAVLITQSVVHMDVMLGDRVSLFFDDSKEVLERTVRSGEDLQLIPDAPEGFVWSESQNELTPPCYQAITESKRLYLWEIHN